MSRRGIHRKLGDETAEGEAVITEVTPQSHRSMCTHMETVHGEEGPGQSPQETQHSRGGGGGRAADRTQGRARGGLRRVKGRVRASKEGPLGRQPSSIPGATVWVQILSLQRISYVDFGP